MEVYWRLPVFVQEAALALYAGYLDKVYYRDGYEEWRRRYQRCRSWSQAEAQAWQNEQLRSLVTLAGTHVPYYRTQWRGLEWRSVRSTDDLRILPTLDKQSIRQNELQFLVEGVNPKSLWVEKTSGTTGTSLKIYWPRSMLPKWWALTEVMVRNVAGVGQDMPRAMMGGRPIVRGIANSLPTGVLIADGSNCIFRAITCPSGRRQIMLPRSASMDRNG